jgi:hypothetical protein
VYRFFCVNIDCMTLNFCEKTIDLFELKNNAFLCYNLTKIKFQDFFKKIQFEK